MLQPLKGFRHFETHHCVTGSLRHLYAFAGHDISEDLLLGLGEGVGFAYFHFKGQLPFLGGRAQPKPSMEQIAGRRTGVEVVPHASSSDAAAEKTMLRGLDEGLPVMLQVDMGYLPYFDFGGHEYHFGGHVIVVCGRDEQAQSFLVADRDKALHEVERPALVNARGSRQKPFPPNRAWWDLDFSGFHPPRKDDILEAIRAQTRQMLHPPISNIGVKGIRKAADEVARWGQILEGGQLRGALFNAWIFIDATGGTGGGAFRRMFSRFLGEASGITGRKALEDSGQAFGAISQAWDRIARQFREAADTGSRPKMAAGLPAISAALYAIADSEESAWKDLAERVR